MHAQRILLMTWILASCFVCVACGVLTNKTQVKAPNELVGSPTQPPSPTRLASSAPKRSGQLWYMLRQDNPNTLIVRMRLLKPATQTSLFLPGPWAGVKTHADAISIRQAVGPKGPRSWTLLRDKGRVDIDTKGLPWIDFEYEVKLAPAAKAASRFSAQRLGRGFFAYAPTLFVLPSAQLSARLVDIPVEIHVPKDHELMSTWSVKRRAPSRVNTRVMTYGYVIKNIGALRDAFIASTDGLQTLRVPGVEVAFTPDFKGQRQEITRLIHQVLGEYKRTYGAVGNVSVLVRTLPRPADELWGTGRRGGFVLELPQGAAVNDALKTLVAHEALHLWNGHTLIPQPKQELRTRWFKEGITHYLALRTAHKLGLIGQAQVLQEWAQAAQRYALYQGTPRMRQNLSHRYHYDRGVMLALALETTFSDAHLIDRWVGHLLNAHRKQDMLYTQERLLQELQHVSVHDAALATFWSAYVHQDKALDIKSIFAQIGLHWLPKAGRRGARLIPLNQPASKQLYLSMMGHNKETADDHTR